MTDEEICGEIEAEITAAIVAHALDKGEPWVKKRHIILIPHEQFAILRKYHEWTRVGGSIVTESQQQEIDLPRARVRNGGAHPRIRVMFIVLSAYEKMQQAMKDLYLPDITRMLTEETAFLKRRGKK